MGLPRRFSPGRFAGRLPLLLLLLALGGATAVDSTLALLRAADARLAIPARAELRQVRGAGIAGPSAATATGAATSRAARWRVGIRRTLGATRAPRVRLGGTGCAGAACRATGRGGKLTRWTNGALSTSGFAKGPRRADAALCAAWRRSSAGRACGATGAPWICLCRSGRTWRARCTPYQTECPGRTRRALGTPRGAERPGSTGRALRAPRRTGGSAGGTGDARRLPWVRL